MCFNSVILITLSLMKIIACQSLISVCPVGGKSSEAWQMFKRTIFCNETLNCKQLQKELVANDYSHFIAIYYNRKNFYQVHILVDKFSQCGISSVILDKMQPNRVADYFDTNKTTVVVDVTDDELFWSVYPGTTMQLCYNKSLPMELQYVEKLLESFPVMIWITKNVHCNLFQSDSYIVKLCKYDCDDKPLVENELFKKTFRVATLDYPPFVNKTGPINDTKYYGIVFEILNEVAQQYHIRYTIVEPADQSYGVFINDSWTGMIGMLKKKEIDFVAAGLTATYGRGTIADFSTAFYSDPISIMIHEQKKPEMLWKLLSLFSWRTWTSILFAALGSAIVIFFLHKYSATDMDTGLDNFHQCIWYVACCLTNQGVDNQPKSWSGMYFLTAWCLASFVLISMYSGGLIAMLTTSRLSTPFTNLKGLLNGLEKNEYTICIENGTALYDNILNEHGEDYSRIRKWLANNPLYVQQNDTSCTELFLKTDNMAYLAELSFLKNLQKKHCQNYSLIILNDEFLAGDFVFAFQKGSPLKPIISSKIQYAKETGLISSWDATYSQKMAFCQIKKPDQKFTADTDQLTMKAFGGAFLILAMGLFISLLWFFIETHQTVFEDCIYTISRWFQLKFEKMKSDEKEA